MTDADTDARAYERRLGHDAITCTPGRPGCGEEATTIRIGRDAV